MFELLSKIAEAILTVLFMVACLGGIAFAFVTLLVAIGLEGLAEVVDLWKAEL